MLTSAAVLAVAAVGLAGLAVIARRDHQAALCTRAALLDDVAVRLQGSLIEIGGDGFPTLIGRLPDRRQIVVTLLPDTLVMRRLPQLWMIVTLHERVERARPSVGALARHTGAEFYSRTLKFPVRIQPPSGLEALLLRGDSVLPADEVERISPVLASIFDNSRTKEIAATRRGVLIVRQVSEGERGAHLLLRQSRFPLTGVAPDVVFSSIADADRLREALDMRRDQPQKLSA